MCYFEVLNQSKLLLLDTIRLSTVRYLLSYTADTRRASRKCLELFTLKCFGFMCADEHVCGRIVTISPLLTHLYKQDFHICTYFVLHIIYIYRYVSFLIFFVIAILILGFAHVYILYRICRYIVNACIISYYIYYRYCT